MTSTALALAAAWPRSAVLVEADPAGGDLAYRCRDERGAVLGSTPSLLTLAAAVRGGDVGGPALLLRHSQRLGGGIPIVQGIGSAGQAAGLTTLWESIAQACRVESVDALVDLGRLPATSELLGIAAAADVVVVVGAASLESAVHLRSGLADLPKRLSRTGATSQSVAPSVVPLLVVDDAEAEASRADLDQLLHTAGILVSPSLHLTLDPRALRRLEAGAGMSAGLTRGLGRTHLMRSASSVASRLLEIGAAPAGRPMASRSMTSGDLR